MADINVFGNPTYFNNDVTFYSDVTIGGEFNYDNLSVKNLEVTEKGTLGILTVTGNSTLGNVKISSGIVTASSGIVTYYGDGSNLDVDGSSLSETISSAVPAGSVFYFASSSAPTGYVKANGAELSKTAYATLFSSIGTTYGETNGSGGAGTSHFRVPDLRGEFVRGWDDGRGADLNKTYTADSSASSVAVTESSSTRTLGSSQSWSIENITGKAIRFNYNLTTSGTPNAFGVWNSSGSERTDGGGNNAYGLSFNAARIVNTSEETRPRNVALLACIKY